MEPEHVRSKPVELDPDWLRQVCLDAGADDVGVTVLTAPRLESERDHVRMRSGE